ncbi:MAG: homocysteine S-methyltransferase [Xanthomonadales bacterium]|nr:homocysteine S-methyltransferase [Xanthomonadales bacterium]
MSRALTEHLEKQGFVLLDGALATELEQKGADLNDPLWSARCLLESPELISEVHSDYLRAGADVIASATYQASEAGFRERGLSSKEARALMQEGVDLAVRARNDFWLGDGSGDSYNEKIAGGEIGRDGLKPLVAVSMGPFGACLHDGSEYHGNYTSNWREVSVFHRERMLWLAEAGADLLAFETIPSLPEAEILLELLEKHVNDLHGLPTWISFSCKDGQHVSHGEPFRECIELIAGSRRVVAAGINCTAPSLVTELLRSVDATDLPLMVYPNSGETWVAHAHCWLGQSDTDFAIEEWFDAGVRLFGGCCRTRPDDIADMRKTLVALGG